MRTSPARLALVVIVFVAALAGALALMQHSSKGGSSDSKDRASSSPDAAKNGIWAKGDRWTVKVRQDAGAISPDGDTSIAEIPFRFNVAEAPKGKDGVWLVRVRQDGAEGPFADGWRLEYKEQGDQMVLYRVAVGNEKFLEAELASIVLGPQFPYEPTYSAPPKSTSLDADKLLDRSQLPPGSLPNAPSTGGATPPAAAPKVGAGAAPPIG